MATVQATVFGGSGFIGRYLARRLARAGARVVAAVRRPERAGFLGPMGDVGQVVPVAADIGDDAAVAAAVAGSDLVVNLVGVLHESGRRTFDAVHAAGAARVARAAAASGARRLVHVSAIGAAADSPAAYGRSKAAGEIAARDAFPGTVIVRPSVVFGPEDDFLNRFAALARLAPALPLPDGGRTRLQPVHVGDVAEGLARAAERPDSAGRVHEFGGPAVHTFREVLEFVLAATGRRALLVPAPRALLALPARLFELLPDPPLTRDQLAMLSRDNVVGADGGVVRLADLGIAPAALEAATDYLARFRPGGGVRPARFDRAV